MAGSGATEKTWAGLDALLPALRAFAHALLAGRERTASAEVLVETAVAQLSVQPGDAEAAVAMALYRGVVQAYRKTPLLPDADVPRRATRGVVAAVARLPLDEREALLLVVLGGFAYRDVSAILGIPRASVVARLARARAALAATGSEPSRRPTHLRVVK